MLGAVPSSSAAQLSESGGARAIDVDARVYPFEPRVLHNLGFRYHYVDEGQGFPVVMVHGNPTWSFYYRNLIRVLSPDYRCLAPDHIGCGRSQVPLARDYPYTLSRRVEDLGRWIDALKLEQVDLVVHDWGGMIALSWAVDHPERVRNIIISNTAAFSLPPGARVPGSLRLARIPGLGALLVRGLNAFCLGAAQFCVTRRELKEEVRAGYLAPYDSWQNRVAVHNFVTDIPLRHSHPSFDRLERTERQLGRLAQHRVLLAWGLRDFVFDTHYLAEFRRRFPGAEIAEFGDCGHYLLEDSPKAVCGVMKDFLDQGSARRLGAEPAGPAVPVAGPGEGASRSRSAAEVLEPPSLDPPSFDPKGSSSP